MQVFDLAIAAGILAATLYSTAPARSSEGMAMTGQVGESGPHDFDFEFGKWRVHHRVKSATGGGAWKEIDGTASCRPLMDGSANIEEQLFFRPDGNTYGVALRAHDKKTGQWAIWWIDSRDPHLPLDPPVKGRFDNGVGTFYSDGLLDGKPVRTRFVWSHITPTSARWEQALSSDGGKTWDTNWIMDFQRVR
jgi:hypothetical protein